MLASPGSLRPLPLPPRDSLPPPPFDDGGNDLNNINNGNRHNDARDADFDANSPNRSNGHHNEYIDSPAADQAPADSTLFSPPTSPNPNNPPKEKGKRSNPLVDLVDSEKIYVDLMAGIIKKVASAWSRSNFPPPDLDVMFRAVEAVYKANRAFLAKLKDIGPNPASPKALGDLLMRWIDDLDGPYTRYCSSYLTGFDTWGPVASTERLPELLGVLSDQVPPPASEDGPTTWTLDALFLLPRARLKYYKKLYARLLKSTQPGRSDHRLLVGANEKLDVLIATIDERMEMRAGEGQTEPPLVPPQRQSDTRDSVGSSARGSSLSSAGERLSRDTTATSSRAQSMTASFPVIELERRLSADRVLDIFTMTRKKCRLQMAPPNLPFVRTLRIECPVTIIFNPRSTGIENVYPDAHIFLLTDLFLVCNRMTPEEKEEAGPDGADMWLSYPPLAGKHLRVTDLEETSFQVHIMKKETLTIQVDSRQVKEQLMREFQECSDMASSMSPAAKPFDPAMAAGLPRPPSAPGGLSPFMGPGSRQGSPAPHEGRMSEQFGQPGGLEAPYRPPPRGSSAGAGFRPPSHLPPPPINTGFLPPRPHQDYMAQPSPPLRGPSPSFYDQNGMASPRSVKSMQPYGEDAPLPPVPRYPPHYAGNFNPNNFGPPPGNYPPGPGGYGPRAVSMAVSMHAGPNAPPPEPEEDSPPTSPVQTGPVTNNVTAQMKCKVFLQQQHQQWKSLGNAKLKLYHQMPTNIKQLVVEADTKDHPVIISTIVLADGVERVGKTGVAVELSDKGVRAGIVYMIQLRNEVSTSGLFNSLLAGSDRGAAGAKR